jgi:dUTP pyrophosphatase
VTPPVEVLITRLDAELPMPAYEHPGDAGLDLRSRIDVTLEPGERSMVPTGVAIALPDGYAAFVCARSGLALRQGIGLVNAPGVVDAGYRGEIGVILVNHDPRVAVAIARGDRIAQLVIERVERARLVEVVELPGSHRGEGGFGSTGGHAGTVTGG